jgi:hypothetical protein
MAFAIGTLRLMAAASAPSASSHLPSGFTPASSSNTASGTPAQSLHDTRPCRPPAVCCGASALLLAPLLPEHSRNWMCDTIG